MELGTSSTFQCSVRCVGVVFSNEALLLVCREQPTILGLSWNVRGLLGDLIDQQQNQILQVSLDHKGHPGGSLSPKLFCNFFQIAFLYVYILRSFCCIILLFNWSLIIYSISCSKGHLFVPLYFLTLYLISLLWIVAFMSLTQQIIYTYRQIHTIFAFLCQNYSLPLMMSKCPTYSTSLPA